MLCPTSNANFRYIHDTCYCFQHKEKHLHLEFTLIAWYWGGSERDSRMDVSVPETECRPQWKWDTTTGVMCGPPAPNSPNWNGNAREVNYSPTKRREKLKSTRTSSTSNSYTHSQPYHQRPEKQKPSEKRGEMKLERTILTCADRQPQICRSLIFTSHVLFRAR